MTVLPVKPVGCTGTAVDVLCLRNSLLSKSNRFLGGKKKKERKRKTEKMTVLGFVELLQYQNVKELLSGPKKKWTKKKGKVRRFPAFKWSFRV